MAAEDLKRSTDDLLDQASLPDGAGSAAEVLESKDVDIGCGGREDADFRLCCVRVSAGEGVRRCRSRRRRRC